MKRCSVEIPAFGTLFAVAMNELTWKRGDTTEVEHIAHAIVKAIQAALAKQQQASASDGEPTLPGMERLANPQTEKVAT